MSSNKFLFSIDTKALQETAKALGATHVQFRKAFQRAMKRTGATLRKSAAQAMKSGLAPRKSKRFVKRLIFSYSGDKNAIGEGRMWFGLDSVKASELKGRVRGSIRQRHKLRDKKSGRFKRSRRKSRGVSFEPKGTMLPPVAFENGEVRRSKRTNQRVIYVREGPHRRAREAEISIYAPMMEYIGGPAFTEAVSIFEKHFDVDIKGRVKANK